MTDSPYKLSYGYINPYEVVRAYKQLKAEFGVCSLGRLREYLKRKGDMLNPVTHQPPTRQALQYTLSRTEEGRALMRDASHSRFLNRPKTGWPEERFRLEEKRKSLKVPEVY